jgi:selenocysteine-specific elongation factor
MTDVRIHMGTSEIMARIVLLDEKALVPGDSGLVQLRLKDPVVTVPGDRFILRLHSPMVTIGGGTVVGLASRRLKRFKEHIVSRVAAKRDSVTDLKAQVLIEAESWPGLLVPQNELASSLNASKSDVDAALRELHESGDLVPVRAGQVMSRERFDRLSEVVVSFLDEQHRANPLAAYVDAKLLRKPTGLDATNLPGLLKLLEEKGLVETAKGGVIRRAGFAPQLTADQEAFLERIEKQVLDGGATPPSFQEIVEGAGIPLDEAAASLRFLLESGRCIRVGEWIYHADVIAEFREAIVAVAKEHGEVVIPLLRDRFKTSRKWIIPLMEYFDGTGLTRRAGDKRYLRK